MLPFYEVEYEPRQSIVDFGSARAIFIKKDYKMFVKRRFE